MHIRRCIDRIAEYIVKMLLVLPLCLSSCSTLFAQNISWYLPWQNELTNLEEVSIDDDNVPLLLKGYNYRILKILNNSNTNLILDFKAVTTSNGSVSVEISSLPIMKNFEDKSILDVIVPLTGNKTVNLHKDAYVYFLVRFKGSNPGHSRVSFSISKSIPSFSVSTTVGIFSFTGELNLNVWAYFNYPLVSGLKSEIINDLYEHKSNVLVIPPNILPPVRAGMVNTEKLNGYLRGTRGKFNKFLLFMGYKHSNFLMSSFWRSAFPNWLRSVQNTMANNGIKASQLMLYPIDEPDPVDAVALVKMIQWCRQNKINVPFFSTISKPGTAYLMNYLSTAQLYSGGNASTLHALLSARNKNCTIWLYEIKAAGRNISPRSYLDMAWRAQKWKAVGIGVWNYSDIGKGYSNSLAAIKQGRLSMWDTYNNDPVHDYSLVYRNGDNLYPSLRWLALTQAKEEYEFIDLYSDKLGGNETNQLLDELLNKKLSPYQWEKIKLSLIQ